MDSESKQETEPLVSEPLPPSRLVSMQVGQTEEIQPIPGDMSDQPWSTAFFKRLLVGPVQVSELGLIGDSQADSENHGGLDKPVCVYPSEHLEYWQSDLGIFDFGAGAFGENLTTEGLTETNVCLGDIWRLGETELQISQPRQPCWKLARRWQVKDLVVRVVKTGYTGWYVRVLKTGTIYQGDTITLVDRPQPEWTLEKANQVMHHQKKDPEAARELASVEQLSESWKNQLSKRFAP